MTDCLLSELDRIGSAQYNVRSNLHAMKRTTTWGIAGAVLFVLVGILCAAVPYDSMFSGAANLTGYVYYPVYAIWQVVFKILGIEGEQGMAYLLPMLATEFLYLAALGFGVGVLAGRVVRPR